MKLPFSHYLLMIATSAIALVGFTACSDDESSSPSDPGTTTTTVDQPPDLATPTELSPIVPRPLSVDFNGDGTYAKIEGGAILDLLDTTAIPADAEIAFTEVSLILAKVTETGARQQTPLQLSYNSLSAPTPNINWGNLSAKITDNNKSDCGTFMLYAVYNATYDINVPNMFVSIDSVMFVRDQQYCEEVQETPPQSQEQLAAQTVELAPFVINIGTKNATGISLETGTSVSNATADLIFTADELTGKITVHGQNGIQVAPYSNNKDKDFDDDWTIKKLPEQAHLSDFRFKKNSLAATCEFESFMFYVAIGPNYNAETGDGFYAFTLQERSDTPDQNGNFDLTIFMFKKK